MCKWSIQILKEKQMKDSPIRLLAFFLKERWRKLKFCFFNFIRHFLVHVWQYVSASTIVFCRWNLSFLHFLIWFNFLHLSWSDRHVSSHFWQISFFFRLILPQIPSFPAQRPPPSAPLATPHPLPLPKPGSSIFPRIGWWRILNWNRIWFLESKESRGNEETVVMTTAMESLFSQGFVVQLLFIDSRDSFRDSGDSGGGLSGNLGRISNDDYKSLSISLPPLLSGLPPPPPPPGNEWFLFSRFFLEILWRLFWDSFLFWVQSHCSGG